MKQTIFLVTACLLGLAGTSAADVSFAPLPGQVFIHQETFGQADPAGFNLTPTFEPYPGNPAWKLPGASQVVDGMLTGSNQNGAAGFDAAAVFGPLGVDLTNNSVALYMRLWIDVTSEPLQVTMGFMNAEAEETAPDAKLAEYLGISVSNDKTPVVSWGGMNDMGNPADETGLQAQEVVTAGWRDYVVLLEGTGDSVSVSAFYKDIDEAAWTALADAAGVTTIDTTMGFDSQTVFFWTTGDANAWKIDQFAISQVPEPATIGLLGLGGLALLCRSRRNA